MLACLFRRLLGLVLRPSCRLAGTSRCHTLAGQAVTEDGARHPSGPLPILVGCKTIFFVATMLGNSVKKSQRRARLGGPCPRASPSFPFAHATGAYFPASRQGRIMYRDFCTPSSGDVPFRYAPLCKRSLHLPDAREGEVAWVFRGTCAKSPCSFGNINAKHVRALPCRSYGPAWGTMARSGWAMPRVHGNPHGKDQDRQVTPCGPSHVHGCLLKVKNGLVHWPSRGVNARIFLPWRFFLAS